LILRSVLHKILKGSYIALQGEEDDEIRVIDLTGIQTTYKIALDNYREYKVMNMSTGEFVYRKMIIIMNP
ncbi:MAG: hypothetical protein Q4F11_09900, partial [Eubacteriales bacterium]|nr:hypothetical protein [Eubacteriales bacterium]